MTMQPRITFDQSDAALVTTLNRKLLDDDLLQDLVPAITDAVDRVPKHVVLDLSAVQYLPSLAIGTLVRLNSELKKRHLRLVLAGPQPGIREVFKITRMDHIFEIANTPTDAAATLGQAP